MEDGATLVASGTESLEGTVIADRFLIQRKLGEGGMGEVYLAEHVRMRRKVALKLMRKSMVGDPVAVSRFHREAENASQISHPNVAQVYDFGEAADGTVYLALEFVEGEPLSAILQREGRLHIVRTAEVVRQIGEALMAAHALGILHRDLKPDNVMVGQTRVGTDLVKLVDFGIARAINRSTQQFTATGMIVGTPDYMSPEQLSGDTLDPRSDLYALGLIAFRALTGTGAFPSGSTGEALIARLTSRPRRLREALPDVEWPDDLQAVLERSLAADPADRHTDPLEFAAALDRAISGMPMGERERDYLTALAQRHPTPARGGAVLDAASRSLTPVSVPTATGLVTPPARPSVQTRVQSTSPSPPTNPASPSGHPWSGEIVHVPVPQDLVPGDARSADASASAVDGAAGDAGPPGVTAAVVAGEAEGGPPPAQVVAGDPALVTALPGSTVSTPSIEIRLPPEAFADEAPPDAGTPMESTGAPPPRPSRWRALRAVRKQVVAGLAAAALVATFMVPRLRRDDTAPVLSPPDTLIPPPPTLALPAAPAPADSAPATVAAPVQAPGRAAIDAVARSRQATVAIWAGGRRGSGVLVEAGGLLLTSAALVDNGPEVDVYLEPTTRVRGTVLEVDSTTGLAAVLVAARRCRRCEAIEPDSAAQPAVGDTLVATPSSGRADGSDLRAAVRSVAAGAPVISGAASRIVDGTPLFSAVTGGLVSMGLRKQPDRAPTFASTASLRDLRTRARARAAGRLVNDTLYPTWPAQAAPNAVLAAEVPRVTAEAAQYRTAPLEGFVVTAMTPQFMRWRTTLSPGGGSADNPFDVAATTATGAARDPIIEWPSWRETVTERRTVVVLSVSPERATFPDLPTRVVDLRRGDARTFELRRDGVPVTPIEVAGIVAVGNAAQYRVERKPVFTTRLASYAPSEFAEAGAKYEVLVIDAQRANRTVTIPIPAALIQRIGADLARLR